MTNLTFKVISAISVDEWSRPIFGLTSNYKGMTREERQQRDLDQQMPQRRRLRYTLTRLLFISASHYRHDNGLLIPLLIFLLARLFYLFFLVHIHPIFISQTPPFTV